MGLVGRKKLLLNLSEFPSLELFNFISVCCSVVSVVPSAAKETKFSLPTQRHKQEHWILENWRSPWAMGWWISIKNLEQKFCPSSVSYAEFPLWTFHKNITQHSCCFSTWWTSGTHFQPHFYIKFNITVLTSHLLWRDSFPAQKTQQIKIFKATRGQSDKLFTKFYHLFLPKV